MWRRRGRPSVLPTTPITCVDPAAGLVDGELTTALGAVRFGPLTPTIMQPSEAPMLLRFFDGERDLLFYFDYSIELPPVGEHAEDPVVYFGPRDQTRAASPGDSKRRSSPQGRSSAGSAFTDHGL